MHGECITNCGFFFFLGSWVLSNVLYACPRMAWTSDGFLFSSFVMLSMIISFQVSGVFLGCFSHVWMEINFGLSMTGIVEVHLDRPETKNAISKDMLRGLRHAFESVDSDPSINVMMICSSVPKVFCAGADLKVFLLTRWFILERFGRISNNTALSVWYGL